MNTTHLRPSQTDRFLSRLESLSPDEKLRFWSAVWRMAHGRDPSPEEASSLGTPEQISALRDLLCEKPQ